MGGRKGYECLTEFKPEYIFSADEIALFCRLLPGKRLTFKDGDCSGGKQSKDRVSVLIDVNMTDAEQRHLLVIATAAKPRCFN